MQDTRDVNFYKNKIEIIEIKINECFSNLETNAIHIKKYKIVEKIFFKKFISKIEYNSKKSIIETILNLEKLRDYYFAELTNNLK